MVSHHTPYMAQSRAIHTKQFSSRAKRHPENLWIGKWTLDPTRKCPKFAIDTSSGWLSVPLAQKVLILPRLAA